ncbi:ribonuclease H-like domain-containing protein [Tanacetum coccineum]
MVAYLQKSEGSEGFHEIIDFLTTSHIYHALIKNPTIYASPIEQFWQTAALCIIKDGVQGITATINRKLKVLVTEASIRRHLKLEDSDGLKTLHTTDFFKQLALMGLSPKKTAWEQFSSNIATAIICLATNRTFNFSNFVFKAMVKNIDSKSKFLMYPRFIQIFLNKHQRLLFPHTRTYHTPTLTLKLFNNMKRISKGYSGVVTPLFNIMLVQHQDEEPSHETTHESSPSRITSSISLSPQTHPSTSQLQTTFVAEEPAPMTHESPLQSVHTLGRDKGSLTLNELTVMCTTLSKKVEDLQNDLQQTKKVYSSALTKLILRVKKLEKQVKTSKARRRVRLVLSEDEDVAEDSSKQGRNISEIDTDPFISLVLLEEEEPTEIVEDQGSGEKGEKMLVLLEQDIVLSFLKLFDSCGIHILLMDNGIAIHIMIEKKYPLTQEMLSKMLSRKLEVDHENEMAFELLRGGLLGINLHKIILLVQEPEKINTVEDLRLLEEDCMKIKTCEKIYMDIKDLGSAKQILGMSIIRDRTKGTLRLSQEKYIGKVLEKFNMNDAEAKCQPVGDQFKLNIAHAVRVVSRFMSILRREHWKVVKWLLHYLQGTSKATLCFSRKESAIHLAKKPVFHSRTKHIKIRYHYIRELVSKGTLSLKKNLGEKNLADMLTKVVAIEKLKLYVASTGLEITDERRLRAKGSRLRAKGSKLGVEGFDVDLIKRSGGRTLLTQKFLGILLLSRAEED